MGIRGCCLNHHGFISLSFLPGYVLARHDSSNVLLLKERSLVYYHIFTNYWQFSVVSVIRSLHGFRILNLKRQKDSPCHSHHIQEYAGSRSWPCRSHMWTAAVTWQSSEARNCCDIYDSVVPELLIPCFLRFSVLKINYSSPPFFFSRF